jgi:hypothetical protein
MNSPRKSDYVYKDAYIIMLTDGTRNRKGRGYTRYYYTVEDIARVTGRVVGTIRNDVSKGRVILGDLASVVEYIKG